MMFIEAINGAMHLVCNLLLKIKVPESIVEVLFEPWIKFYFRHEWKRWEEALSCVKEAIYKRIQALLSGLGGWNDVPN